jgi:hypothetical protein
MLKIKSIFDQISRKLVLSILVSLVLLLSLPVASVHASGYYSDKTHKVEIVRPFYSTKERKIVRDEVVRPFYSTQERRKEKVYTTPSSSDDYIESGKRAGEVIPKDLGTGSRQKNPVNMLKRKGEEY